MAASMAAVVRLGGWARAAAARRVSQVSLAEASSTRAKLINRKFLITAAQWKPLQNNFSACNGIRFCSTDASSLTFSKPGNDVLTWKSTNPSDAYVPEPPEIPVSTVLPDAVNALGEPTLASQGLGGWSPVGIVETCLDFLHVSGGFPWWLSIAAGTIVIRFTMFPVFIIAQRNAAKMHNVMPQMQILQMKMTEARNTGNSLLAAKYAHDLMQMMKEKDIKPFRNMLAPLCQAPVFISFFFALREMANLPMESMKAGGALWFFNLTVPDPLYLLPLITSATLFLTLELGADGGMEAKNYQMMRYVLRAIPIIVFPFTVNFPAAVLCYWTTSNLISLGMVGMMKVPSVGQFFKIPVRTKHNVNDLPVKKKKFTESFKEAMTNARIARELGDREHVDEIRFRKAGMGPIPKTFPYDPTKQHPSAKAAHAKGRDDK